MNVSAQAGNSDGGGFLSWAYITSVANGLNNPVINAVGNGTGKGGKVQSYLNSTGFDVNKYIKVDGGQNLLGSAENDFGRITLNSVACQQRTTGQTSSWPKAYWNCANPDGSLTTDGDMRDAVVGLPSSFKTTLGDTNNNAQLYIMLDGSKFNNYFQPSTWIGTPVGYNLPSDYEHGVAVVFETTLSGVDYTPYLRANIMHEIAHLLDEYITPHPISTTAWTSKRDLTKDDMEGDWPSPQNPTCMDVFNFQPLCDLPKYQNTDPWQILQSEFMGGQNLDQELFAFAFQNCSGYQVENSGVTTAKGLNNAERSTYMRDVYDYMNVTFWPGGCTWQP